MLCYIMQFYKILSEFLWSVMLKSQLQAEMRIMDSKACGANL